MIYNFLKTIFLIIIFFPFILFSQTIDSLKVNEYIEIMDNKLSVKLDIDNDIVTFTAEENGVKFDIKPNIDYRSEISIHYRFISFKLGFSPHLFTNFDEEEKGETKIFKFETDIFINKWVQTLGYSQVKGFYSPNFPLPEDYPSDYLILDQLKTKTFKGITRYRFNDNYSFKSYCCSNRNSTKKFRNLHSCF